MLQGWHSGSHAPGCLCGAAGKGAAHLSPPPWLLSCLSAPQQWGGIHPGLPEPGGYPAGGVGGTDAVGTRVGKASPAPGQCPIWARDCAPSCPTSGPMGPVPRGGRWEGRRVLDGDVTPSLQRCIWACGHAWRKGAVPGRPLSPTGGLIRGRDKGGAVGGLSRGSGGVMAIPYGMFWEILLTPG